MLDVLRPIVELSAIIPGVLLAYFPMKHHLKVKVSRLAAVGMPVLILLCILGGLVSFLLKAQALWAAIPIVIALSLAYCATLNISHWKSISVILAICAIYSCLGSITRAIDSIITPYNTEPWFSLSAVVSYNLFCWAFVLLAWYPAVHPAAELIDNDGIVQTWYVFWLLPCVFIALNLFMIPIHPDILHQGRISQGYILIGITFLAILILFYVLFYFMAKSLNKNDRLRQENQFLSLQQAQYDRLCNSIEETKQARHDMRHHFSVITALVNRKEWAELNSYLAQARESIPASELQLCDNPAVDSVASHYCLRYKENNIPYTAELNLPYKLPVSDIDICLVLSNLMENALEAILCTKKAKRKIKVQAYLHSENVVVITVENTFDHIPKEKNGIFQSSKHSGNGIGIESVRHIAEKKGGYCRFVYSDGLFSANVMLRGVV